MAQTPILRLDWLPRSPILYWGGPRPRIPDPDATMSELTITAEMTMEQIIEVAPAAQRALFQRYHVGGCSSCGFQPTDTLGQVCKDHNILDVNEVMQHVMRSHEADAHTRVPVSQVQEWLAAGEEFRFIDVRQPEELAMARIEAAEPLDFGNSQQYMELPRETKIVFMCKSGMRSLDVAAYFAGHGFTQVFAMEGGLDAWRAQVDPSIPDY